MEKINGIIKDGKIFVATEIVTTEFVKKCCLMCDLKEDGGCPCWDYCFDKGPFNCFRYSPELTERLKGGKA